ETGGRAWFEGPARGRPGPGGSPDRGRGWGLRQAPRPPQRGRARREARSASRARPECPPARQAFQLEPEPGDLDRLLEHREHTVLAPVARDALHEARDHDGARGRVPESRKGQQVRHDHGSVAIEANIVVQQQEIERLRGDPRESLPDVPGHVHLVAVGGQDRAQTLPRVNVAPDNENSQRHSVLFHSNPRAVFGRGGRESQVFEKSWNPTIRDERDGTRRVEFTCKCYFDVAARSSASARALLARFGARG